MSEYFFRSREKTLKCMYELFIHHSLPGRVVILSEIFIITGTLNSNISNQNEQVRPGSASRLTLKKNKVF